jgi:UDP-N-acetylmuramate: L-alanyl-gamma-D-glutamyl-meso-diaminopimelate ligase
MANTNTTRVHFIAIGGSAMHNLALALHQKGFHVTGSDDEINEPSKSRLEKAGILPPAIGWFPEKLDPSVDAVILGMHARIDNPELLKAQELGLKIYSYPEYLYKQSENKQRVVIAGSHGKTSITSMILHVLKFHQKEFDYMVGAQLEGFDTMVKLSDAPVIVIEGDEYFASPLDRTPKFLHYKHHIGLISGIAWDHINVYPTFEEYVKQFEAFADSSPKGGILIYSDNDDLAEYICDKERDDVTSIDYPAHKHEIVEGISYLLTDFGRIPLLIFGKHNMRNIAGAKEVCLKLGVNEEMFYQAIKSFKGAANRLEILNKNYSTIIFKDFAHAPSKVKATTNAVKKQYERKDLVAVLELHTFSSLTKDFLIQYKDCFKSADIPVVYYNPETIKHKKLQEITSNDVSEAFACDKLKVFTSSSELEEYLKNIDWNGKNLLMMSSGNFGGIDLKSLAKELVED